MYEIGGGVLKRHLGEKQKVVLSLRSYFPFDIMVEKLHVIFGFCFLSELFSGSFF
jgi:hypothetical protein